jgi:hypothetical protein
MGRSAGTGGSCWRKESLPFWGDCEPLLYGEYGPPGAKRYLLVLPSSQLAASALLAREHVVELRGLHRVRRLPPAIMN